MAVDWNDPLLWISGGGTAMGALGGLYGALSGQSSYDALVSAAQKQQRQAQASQQQALEFMRQREAQMQTLANQPVNVGAYQAPMQDAQIAALRREALANSSANMTPPDLAQRIFMTEILPKLIQSQYMQAAGLAQTDRSNQLAALGWMPSAQAQVGNLNPGGAGVLSALSSRQGGGGQGMGDVSALANYFKYQQMRGDQQAAQQAASANSGQWMNYLRDAGRAPVPAINTKNLFGVSGYDPHADRIGTKGLDTGLNDYGSSADYGNTF